MEKNLLLIQGIFLEIQKGESEFIEIRYLGRVLRINACSCYL